MGLLRMTQRKRAVPGEGLAPLRGFSPKLIVDVSGKDRLQQFILALALVFNDLKGLLYWRELYLPFQPGDGFEISAPAGEWRGMDLQFRRLLLAHLYELLELINAYNDVARGEKIESMLSHAHPATRRQWSDLVKVATGVGTPRDKAFARILKLTRHQVAFHYYQPGTIVTGFREWFYDSPKRPENSQAFVSIGKTMEATRFFFADAAVQGALNGMVRDQHLREDRFQKALTNAVDSANNALRFLVVSYIDRDQSE